MMFLFSSCFFAPISATPAGAQAPVWHEGDAWAMGESMDLGTDLAGPLHDLIDSLGGTPGASLDQFEVSTNASAWLLFRVTEATSTQYALQGKMALKLNAEMHVKLTAEMLRPGTYALLDPNKPMESRTLQLDASLDYALVVDTTTTFDKQTMAIKNIATDVKTSAIGSLQLKNLPNISASFTSVTISYQNFDFNLKFNLNVDLNLAFDPWLDLFDFPLNMGDEWTVDSNATLTGSMSGILDVTGLPSGLEQQLFSDLALQEMGITKFPVDFGKISTSGQPKITNGTLEAITEHIHADMGCISATLVTLPFHGEVMVYEIQVDNGPQRIYYSDQVGFLTSFQAKMGGNEMGGVQIPDMDMTLPSASPSDAESQINDITSYESSLSNQATASGTSSLVDLFTKAPYIGLIGIAALVLVLVAAVVLVRRKK